MKRFIDTGLFDDPWFMEASKDAKLLWMYVITKCDHGGVVVINEKLCKFQTGIDDVQRTINEVGRRLYKIKDGLYFIPKFIEYQYPNFPNSTVNQQKGAIAILERWGLFVSGELIPLNGVERRRTLLDNVSVNDNESVYENELLAI